MNQTRPKRRKGWFWTGVGLLSGSVFLWSTFALALVQKTEGAIWVVIPLAILTGVGIFCVMRGMRAPAPKMPLVQQPIIQSQTNEKLIVAGEGVSKLEEAASFAKREARRRKLWYAGQLTFITLAIVFWNLFGYGMAYEKDAGIPMGGLITAAICTGLAIYCTRRMGRITARQKISSIRALEEAGTNQVSTGQAMLTLPDRNVTVDEFTTIQNLGQYGQTSVPHTRIRVEHKGRIPCVIQVKAKRREQMKFFDKDVYMEWRNELGRDRSERGEPIPKKVKIYGRKVHTALPKESIPTATEWARFIFDDPNIAILEGFITIEPDQILWVRREGLLPRDFLEEAVKLLACIAENIEKYG